jgi:hypothetical protein
MQHEEKLSLILDLVHNAESNLKKAKEIILEITGGSPSTNIDYTKLAASLKPTGQGDGQIVEGIFNGQAMIGPDGKEYAIPANYASKSKLVPGDTLKLTIREDGSFLYKQIKPAERKRLIGTLAYEDGQYQVIAEGKAYKVLLASVTYFRGEVGDKVTIVVPAEKESEWGAIENLLPQGQE